MITFLVCLAALVISYFTYGKYLEKTCEINRANPVPSKTMYDGVDYLPLPRWKVFLIQLLNIAGLGQRKQLCQIIVVVRIGMGMVKIRDMNNLLCHTILLNC